MWKFAFAHPEWFALIVAILGICAAVVICRFLRHMEICENGYPQICACCEAETAGD